MLNRNEDAMLALIDLATLVGGPRTQQARARLSARLADRLLTLGFGTTKWTRDRDRQRPRRRELILQARSRWSKSRQHYHQEQWERLRLSGCLLIHRPTALEMLLFSKGE